MKYPIIIVADGTDVDFFSSEEAAALSLEAVDVQDGVYQAYDADANFLTVSLPEGFKKTRFLCFTLLNSDGKIAISDNAVKRTNKKGELCRILCSYYHKIGIVCPDQSTLETLIKTAEDHNLIKHL